MDTIRQAFLCSTQNRALSRAEMAEVRIAIAAELVSLRYGIGEGHNLNKATCMIRQLRQRQTRLPPVSEYGWEG